MGADFVHPLATQAVDDTGLVAVFGQQALQLLQGLVLFEHAIVDVGAVETGDEGLGLHQSQLLHDVVAGLGVGGGGEGQQRDAGKTFLEQAQLGVLGAEVVSPLGHAMGLVDGKQGQRYFLQALQEVFAQQAFGGDVEQVEPVAVQAGEDIAGLFGLQAGIEAGSPDAVGLQGVDLVLHQRDQWRHHDGGAGADQGRDLVAQGFAAAGGHEHEAVLAGQGAFDDLALDGAKVLVTEDLAQHSQGGVGVFAQAQHFLYFLPLPQGQGSLRPGFLSWRRGRALTSPSR